MYRRAVLRGSDHSQSIDEHWAFTNDIGTKEGPIPRESGGTFVRLGGIATEANAELSRSNLTSSRGRLTPSTPDCADAGSRGAPYLVNDARDVDRHSTTVHRKPMVPTSRTAGGARNTLARPKRRFVLICSVRCRVRSLSCRG